MTELGYFRYPYIEILTSNTTIFVDKACEEEITWDHKYRSQIMKHQCSLSLHWSTEQIPWESNKIYAPEDRKNAHRNPKCVGYYTCSLEIWKINFPWIKYPVNDIVSNSWTNTDSFPRCEARHSLHESITQSIAK